MQTQLFSLGKKKKKKKQSKRRKNSKFKIWEVLYGESVAQWCHVLLLSAHSKSVVGPTQAFIIINKISHVSSLVVHIFNWTVDYLYAVCNERF